MTKRYVPSWAQVSIQEMAEAIAASVYDYDQRQRVTRDALRYLVEVRRQGYPFGENEYGAECTGVTASYCPVHGDCTCPDEHDECDIGYGSKDLNDPTCALHSSSSTHPIRPGG